MCRLESNLVVIESGNAEIIFVKDIGYNFKSCINIHLANQYMILWVSFYVQKFLFESMSVDLLIRVKPNILPEHF